MSVSETLPDYLAARPKTLAEMLADKAPTLARPSDGSMPTQDPFQPDTSPTALAPAPPSGSGPPTPEDDANAIANDPGSPDVSYFLYALDRNGEPLGLLRVVTTQDGEMRIDRVDSNGQWVEDNSLLPDLGPADPMNDNSDWAFTDDTPEIEARQVYDQHFAKGSKPPSTPPTQTEQSPPASGSTSTPTTFSDGTAGATGGVIPKHVDGGDRVPAFLDNSYILNWKQAEILEGLIGDRDLFVAPALIEWEPDSDPFTAGLGRKLLFVPSDHPRYPTGTPGGLGGKFRPKIRVNIGGKEIEMVDDVSVPGQPPVAPETLAKIKLLGIDKGMDHVEKGEKAKTLLGDARDTESLYQVNGEYTPARAALHQRLVDQIFKGHSPKPEGQRVAVFAAGGTASGKSSAFRADPSLKAPDSVEVNADDFKVLLPEWEYMTGGDGPPDPYAAQALHEESSYLAKLATARALEQGYNVFVDGTGDSGPNKFLRKMEGAKASGHRVEVLMVDAPTNTAIERMVARGSRERRYVPIPDLKMSHRSSVARVAEWGKSPVVSRFSVWRTTRKPPILVMTGGGGIEPTVHDAQQWAEMIAKPGEEGGQ